MSLYNEHDAPSEDHGYTFVFFNALTGDTSMWQSNLGPTLRKAGHGTLLFNYRGQPQSPFDPSRVQDAAGLVADCCALIESCAPVRPIFVGLSIGGLFAARAHLAGAEAHALVLINTLRRDGARLRWINDAVVRAVEAGGAQLLKDLYTPLLMNEAWQADNRQAFLTSAEYTPIDRDSGTYHLLRHVGTSADWDLDYEALRPKTLVITGEQDRVFRDPNDIATLAARIPNVQRLDLPNAGHMVPVEQPDALTKALLDFTGELA